MIDFLEDKKDNLDEEISKLLQGLCNSIEGRTSFPNQP